ncbi:Rab3 GTPase-activating protein catalytic subunit [Hypsibius exemplaris]|uniref:Rab3 GTPase-activating protein catalytic subunit n=1 Tax=Hypsibius exemplaris TaxID=2072580 RepID=A0A1W0WJ18_HYPEX|nr:Rab3 GTPase-activating protein catalytic subunit [Hypsibius exemplaris]
MVTLGETDSRVKYRKQSEERDHLPEETEMFEITDFTTASDWERFIARLEDAIHDWKLPRSLPETTFLKDSFVTGKWKECNSDITDVPDFEYLIKRLYLPAAYAETLEAAIPATRSDPPRLSSLSKTCFSVNEFPALFEQMLSMENDFPNSATLHPLCRWFGLADFLVITASPFNQIDWQVKEDRIKLIQSSMVIAVANTKCPIPMFLQFGELSRLMFVGVSEVAGFRTLYEIIDLERVPDRMKTLSGLVEIFKDKISQRAEEATQLIKTSIQLTLELNPDEVDFEGLSDELIEDRKPDGLGCLPFGPSEFDSFVLRLLASWPNANADAIEDTLLHSDLDPLQAPKWAVQLNLNEGSSYRLSDTLMNFAKQVHKKETVQSYLEFLERDIADANAGDQATAVLNRLTGEGDERLRSRLSKALYSRLPTFHLPVPIDAESLNEILAYLFPDSELAKDEQRVFPAFSERSESAFKTIKGAPINSLPFRLALTIQFVFDNYGGLLGVAYLWHEILLELRYRWENGHLVPGVEAGMPNHGSCLLNQKLQMLNCCIAKREAGRVAAAASNDALAPVHSKSPVYYDGVDADVTDDDDEEDDEFFDCVTDDSGSLPGEAQGPVAQKPLKPEGRKELLGTLTLLRDTGMPLYVPITQESAPMTEDMAQEHLERMVATDDDEDGRAARMRMQSVALVSDMSAFKAANPGCVFEDFVRWHSPRDWEVDSAGGEGHLSERMSQAGSAWIEAWDSAEPKSVRKQKRLFDECVEAEKVLSYLTLTIGGVFRHALPMLLQAGLTKLFDEMDATEISPPCEKGAVLKSVSRLLSDTNFSWLEYEKLIKLVRLTEQIISTHRTLESVAKKTRDLPDRDGFRSFLRTMVEARQLTAIPGGARSPLGQCLAAIFDQRNQRSSSREGSPPIGTGMDEKGLKKRCLPAPSLKEFILRTVAPRPYQFSRPGVHRMYTSIRSGEVRIAGAFTEDLMYG